MKQRKRSLTNAQLAMIEKKRKKPFNKYATKAFMQEALRRDPNNEQAKRILGEENSQTTNEQAREIEAASIQGEQEEKDCDDFWENL